MAFFFGSGGGKLITPPTHAINAFGLNGSVFFNNHPMHKFMFAVKINFNPAAGISLSEEDLTLIVKNVKIGGISVDTEEVNEYNRVRLLHNKLKFQDTTVTMHDVADGKTMRLWKEYYEYYFADGRLFPGFGYDTALIQGNNRRYAIDDIEIYQFQAGKATKTTLEKPKIVSFDHDTADYETTEGLMQMSFTFKPEFVTYSPSDSIPDFVQRQLQKGGTPEQLSSAVGQFIASTQNKKTPKELRSELTSSFSSNVSSASRDELLETISTTSTQTTPSSKSSSTSATSTSVLDSLGRLTKSPTRSVPTPQNANNRGIKIELDPKPVNIDDTSIGNVINGNEQGGND